MASPPSAFCSNFFAVFSAVDVTDAAALFVALIRHAFLCAENIWRLFRPRPDVRRAEDGSGHVGSQLKMLQPTSLMNGFCLSLITTSQKSSRHFHKSLPLIFWFQKTSSELHELIPFVCFQESIKFDI